MFKYFDEFHRAAIYHFILSLISSTLFALGLYYSRGSDGEGIHYYIPAGVLSGVHFFLCIVAILLFWLTSRRGVEIKNYDYRLRKHFSRLKTIYTLALFPSFMWSIVGASMTGTTGICANEEAKCSYTVNKGGNRAIAIVIIVLHIYNGVSSYWLISTTRSATKTDVVIAPRVNIADKTNFQIKLAPRKTHLPANDDNGHDPNPNPNKSNNTIVDQKKKQNQKQPTPLRRHHSALPTLSGSVGNRDSLKNDRVIKDRRKREPVADDHQIGDVKPLPKKKKNLFPAVGKFVLTMNTVRSKRKVKAENANAAFQLASSSSNSSNSSSSDDESPTDKKNRNRKIRLSLKSKLDQTKNGGTTVPPPMLPPPSYNDVVGNGEHDSVTNPYWLPPLRHGDSNMHSLPENMYSGTSYPDTELFVVEPSTISNR